MNTCSQQILFKLLKYFHVHFYKNYLGAFASNNIQLTSGRRTADEGFSFISVSQIWKFG